MERKGRKGKEKNAMERNAMEWNGKERDANAFNACSAGPPLLPRPDPPHAADCKRKQRNGCRMRFGASSPHALARSAA